jgi:hypothetical protein
MSRPLSSPSRVARYKKPKRKKTPNNYRMKNQMATKYTKWRKIYQMDKKYTKWTKNIPNGQKIYQMDKK